MQGTSFLVAWMTSEASTELTEKASSLEDSGTQTEGRQDPPSSSSSACHSPQVQHQTGHHARLSGLSLRNIVEEQFTVGDHGEDPLPALLHAAGLRDLSKTHALASDAEAATLAYQRCQRSP